MKKVEPADFPKLEADMLKTWEKEKTFELSLENRKGAERFSFYDGPPFANGLPHYGHVVPVTVKDSITRYKTMRGYYVPRRTGWDTHGLPVETEVEKQLGITGKRQILELGIDKFNQACRVSVFKYKGEWEEFFRRIGRWADKKNSYATLDDDYIESVWSVFSEIYKKGLIYQGFKSMPYCPRCATPLSNFEVNQNYKDNTEDPSVFVTFPLGDEPGTSLLAWTTTPWTLPANAALAIDAKADYAKVELGDGSKLILAKQRLEVLDLRQNEYKISSTFKGAELVGRKYRPLYEFVKPESKAAETTYKVYAEEAVSLDEGTGVLHIAPAYGEEDLAIGQKRGLAMIQSVDGFGRMTQAMGEFAGQFFKEADPHIIADLTKKGRIFAAETFTHTYPFCWRCETPLMYYATPSWFVEVTKLVDKLVKNNQQVQWVPEHIKNGRFGNWLAEARDWSISRNRFWGAPIPVWQCGKKHNIVVGSFEELRHLSSDGKGASDLHRPGIDQVKLVCPECKSEAHRVEEVLDCWFESGSMPYAQDHYPFENREQFKQSFPADFIAEAMDQTRGWFYTLHVLASAMFDQPAFKNVVVNGIVVAADGKKLSKRLQNYPPLEEVFTTVGADTLRFFMMSSPVVSGEDVRFSADALQEVNRNVFMTLWNVLSFLTTYAQISGWKPSRQLDTPASDSLLDQWILARLDQTIAETTKQADGYQVNRAVRPLRELIDDLSNWYVRRSRRRFSKNEDTADQQSAFATLHYVLVRLSQLMAPWTPFVADRLWRELTAGMDVAQSVHLSDWPAAKQTNHGLLSQMELARNAVTEGLSLRAAAGIKVRQPLADLELGSPDGLPEQLLNLIAEEVNVKQVAWAKTEEVTVGLNTEITQELEKEGLARDLIRLIQSLRKEESLQVDDRIELWVEAPDQLVKDLGVNLATIRDETGAEKVNFAEPKGQAKQVRLGSQTVRISLKKL